MQKQLFLNTKEADIRHDGSSDVTFNFNQQIAVRDEEVLSVAVASAVIPSSFYVIHELNNTLVYTENTGSNTQSTITLDSGNPSVSHLVAELATKLGMSFAVTYNSVTNRMVITNSLHDFALLPSSTCLKLLGFNPSAQHPSTHNGLLNTLTSDNCVDLAGPRCLYLETSSFSTDSLDSRGDSNILAAVPNIEPAGHVISYAPNMPHTSTTNTRVVTSMRIMLRDHENEKVNLNGLDYSLVLLLRAVPR